MKSRNHFYNPFTDPFLGGLAANNKYDSSFEPGIILEDIDLYFQPVPDPVMASIFFFIMMILVAIGSYITIKVLAILQKDDSLLKNTTQNFMVSQLILWTLAVALITITNFIHSFPPEIIQWICPVLWFVTYFCLNFNNAHSCITAMMRYFFIVHTERVESIGKEKVKKFFHVISILIPFLITLWKATDGSELDILSWFNKCYGKHHKTFLIETSTLNVFKKKFCDIPDYHAMENYVVVIEALLRNTLCLTCTAIMILIGSNLTEGIIYCLLFSHMNR